MDSMRGALFSWLIWCNWVRLQKMKAQRDVAEATLSQLREEMAILLKSMPHNAGESNGIAELNE